jgi:hypothetical protein
MKCESIRKWFSLYLYGELSAGEEEAFLTHLGLCEACRSGLEQEKRLHRALDAVQRKPAPELLESCRGQLRQSIRGPAAWKGRHGFVSGLLEAFNFPRPWAKAAGAAALVAVGFFAARLASPPAVGMDDLSEGATTQIRQVTPGPGGEVEVLVDVTRPRVFSGTLEDGWIRALLLAGAQDPEDPAVRVDALDLLKARPELPEIRSVLLFAAEHDPNDGVRLKALEGLRSLTSDPESRRVLSRVLLTESNPGVRSTAVDLLAPVNAQDVVETLQQLLMHEQNDYIRMRSQQALQTMRASVETF